MKHLFKNILYNISCSYFPLSIHGRQRADFENIFEGIYYVLRSGCQWRMLKNKHSWQTVHRHFTKWSNKGLFEKAYNQLLQIYLKRFGHKRRAIITDCSFVKNLYWVNCLGKSSVDRGRQATKVSVISDEKGVVWGATFHKGNKCDYKAFLHTLTQRLLPLRHNISYMKFYGDKAYDINRCRSVIEKLKLVNKCCMRRQANNSLSKVRIVVEHVFSWLDKFRRLIVRYEQSIVHYKSLTFMALSYRLERVLTGI